MQAAPKRSKPGRTSRLPILIKRIMRVFKIRIIRVIGLLIIGVITLESLTLAI